MRSFIIICGLLLAAGGSAAACFMLGRARATEKEAGRIETGIAAAQGRIAFLEKFRAEPAVPLGSAYVATVNVLQMIARAHRAALTISPVSEGGSDMARLAVPSAWPGLKEMRLQIVFRGIHRPDQALSLVDAVCACQQEIALLWHQWTYEKDAIMLDISVMGP